MKKVKSIFAICAVAAMIASCEKKEEFGKVVFKNRSVNNFTMNVVWDGSVIASLYPQMDSDTFEVKEGPHSLVFKIANNGKEACNKGNPSINEGYSHTFICSY